VTLGSSCEDRGRCLFLAPDGATLRGRIREMGLEGTVSKRIDERYESGRTETWIKAPCRQRDTFVVIGWALKGSKFDGFYLGELRALVYAGKIEGGWTIRAAADATAAGGARHEQAECAMGRATFRRRCSRWPTR
jgi:ATP-dependent DNA ligase